ncbi:MAG: NAD(P)/FAD-dependent oxidoreductase [Myxococcales bacterium]|nr:NAD(P)/FAD-dependent oxidoreductase [Myxococcales bacterium]
MAEAVVVGSGPNGLAAAIALAQAGVKVRVCEAQPTIGGGTRSAELTLPGFVHDVCSAIHPMGAASPFFSRLPLAENGLTWIHPEIDLAHPLDDGTAVTMVRSIDDTAAGLGVDGPAWRRMVGPLAGRFHELLADTLGPLTRRPGNPLLLARFGLRAALPSSRLGFEGERTRALIAGLAAHSFLPLHAPFTSSFVLMFAAAAHASGWPLARGGSQKIADALAATLKNLGGEVAAGERVDSLDRFGDAKAFLFDTSAWTLEKIAGDRLPARYRKSLREFRRGPGVFKLDYALSAPIPWRAPECRRAGTVHVGGRFDEIAAGEAAVARGDHPENPFVLVAQQSVFDPSRAPPGKHTLWAYCHVPNGSAFDMTERIERQIERFAPGFRETVLERSVMTCADVEARNANCAGGDIAGGAYDGMQFFARPVMAVDPYATPARELYLCSASTPPGAGVHGMCGFHAARSALRRSFAKL